MSDIHNDLKHVAIIMDGNRRWATEKGLPKMIGHTEGAKNLKTIVRACIDQKIDYVTLWALSTENVQERSSDELNHLFSLFARLIDYLGDLFEHGVRVQTIGDLSKLPENVQSSLRSVVEKTKDNTTITMVLAVNYGGRDELIRAIQALVGEGVPPEAITEEIVTSHLDTAGMPEPELIIRTGGAQRLSGYLPWQSTYSELYFTPVYWPAFDATELGKAIEWYRGVQRNRGK